MTEEERKREIAKRRLAKIKVIQPENQVGQESMKEQLLRSQQEFLQKRQKTEEGPQSEAILYQDKASEK